MNNLAYLEASLHECIATSFLGDGQAVTLTRRTDLLGVLDSLQLLRLVVQLESRYGVKVQDSELAPENLGSIEKIALFIDRKRADSAEPTEITGTR